jgi:glyoxylate/hydroxypyruvate reductase A
MPIALFAAQPQRWAEYRDPLEIAFEQAGLSHITLTQNAAPKDVDYIIYAPNSDLQDFTAYTNLKAVLNLWAGVEDIVGNPTLKAPLARMVDQGLTDGMVEWVTGHVLRHHLNMDTHIHGQDGIWRLGAPPLAKDRTIAVLGLGVLGHACADMLSKLKFNVLGWSRRAKSAQSYTAYHGDEGLTHILQKAEIVVLLLPDTPATTDVLNADRIAQLPRGAIVINPGRGPLIDDDALIDALDNGHIAHATLDVFRHEPLPKDHPFWAHPNVTVTPHIASQTRPDTAAQIIAENICRAEQGRDLLYLVDRRLGY